MKKIQIPISGYCSVLECDKESAYVFVLENGDTYETCEEHQHVRAEGENDFRED